MSERTYVSMVEKYRSKRMPFDEAIAKAKEILPTILSSKDQARALAMVLVGVRDGTLDFAISAAHDVMPGNWTLADCLSACRTGHPDGGCDT